MQVAEQLCKEIATRFVEPKQRLGEELVGDGVDVAVGVKDKLVRWDVEVVVDQGGPVRREGGHPGGVDLEERGERGDETGGADERRGKREQGLLATQESGYKRRRQ